MPNPSVSSPAAIYQLRVVSPLVCGGVCSCTGGVLHVMLSEIFGRHSVPLESGQLPAPKDDPDPKALCCYGLLRADTDAMLLRFVQGRPVSQVTEEFLAWVCERLTAEGRRALLLVGDNAAWHNSQRVRDWIRAHNRRAKREGGVRILVCALPTKSPWLNRIDPYWVHGKRAIVEAERKLTAAETIERVCAYFGCEPFPPLTQQLN